MGTPAKSYASKRARDERLIAQDALCPNSASVIMLAKLMLAQSNGRRKYIPDATFEDPQWLMMLELFVACEEGRDVSVSSLCFASGVPATTALRHIRGLTARGVFHRVSHPRDRRISLVRLSAVARRQMIDYLVSIGSGKLEIEEGPTLRTAH